LNAFLEPTRRGRHLGVVASIVAGVLVVVAALVWIGVRSADTSRPAAGGTEAIPSEATSLADGRLKLIKGAESIDGVSVGYPHSTAGAVSAAAEYLAQICSTLDPDRARQIARVTADPSFVNADAYFANAPINTRRRLGLPTTGPVPLGASVVLGPAAYQIRAASANSMIVLILGYLTTQTATTGVNDQIGVFPVEIHWAAGDWKLIKPGVSTQADYSSLSAKPGSPDADAKGWLELTP
jgi:hypothetical protein